MFLAAESFNQPIGRWDVSNVLNMSVMFSGAESFNQPIGEWDVSNVTSIYGMFQIAESFNQPIGGWDVGNVKDLTEMFSVAESFNQPLGDWDVSNVINMSEMFDDAESFNQDVSKWEINKRTKTSIYDGLSFDEIMSKLESEYFGENESVSQSTLSTETKNRSNSIQQETLSMYIPIYNVMISEKSIVKQVLKKLRESESNSDLNNYCKKYLMGSFAIPNDLKDELEVLEIKIGILQCDTYDDSDIFFDLEFDIVFNIKTEKKQAIKAIQSFEKNNHDLRLRAIPLWNQNNNNFIDSWDKTIIEERIEEIPQWYID
jgi:surface protein